MVEIWQRVVGEFTETWGELAEKYFLLSLKVIWRRAGRVLSESWQRACRELAKSLQRACRERAESGRELAKESLRNHRK